MSMNFTDAIVLAVEKVKAWIQSGGVKWDHVSGKPFVKVGGDTLTWDGNTEGLVLDETFGAYKLSDATPAMTDLSNASWVISHNGTDYIPEASAINIQEDDLSIFCNVSAVTVIVIKEDVNEEGLVLSKGLYSAPVTDDGNYTFLKSLTIPGYTGFAKEQIDPKVLPEALQFGDYPGVIVEEQTVTFSSDGQAEISTKFQPTVGDSVVVEFNGATYKCQTKNMFGLTFAGNAVLLGGDDSGEPFAIMFSGNMAIIVSSDGIASTATIKVSGTRVEKILSRYVDSAITLYTDGTYLYFEAGQITKLTFDDLTGLFGATALFVQDLSGSLVKHQVAAITTDNAYAAAIVSVFNPSTDTLDLKAYYTAEYTA